MLLNNRFFDSLNIFIRTKNQREVELHEKFSQKRSYFKIAVLCLYKTQLNTNISEELFIVS
jgi:hypothetical protein